jgi:DNA-binding CsgD family transcriptional regulator/PAS domain-containing protein
MSDGISAERLSQLVGLIYDAAIDPARWPTVMEEIRTELGFHNSTLNLQHLPSGRMLTNVTTNITPEYLAMMEGAGPDVIEQWGGAQVAMSIPLDEPAVLTQVNPAFDVRTTTNRYYLAFARPQGIVDVMAIGLARDERGIGTLSFGRHEKAGPIGAREIAVARLLVPHLQRAATINRMLDEAVLARASFEATLELLAVPVVLVDRDSRMLYANPPARLMLERGDTIRLQDGALEARNAGAASALAVAIAHAARNESGIARRGLGIPLHGGGGGGAGALHVLPLRPGRAGGESGAVAAVFVAQADAPFVAPTAVVASLFDLTPAEARVFEQVASGRTVAEAAVTLGVGQSTAKTHLLRIYGKVGVRRQSALMQIAASLAPPVLQGDG